MRAFIAIDVPSAHKDHLATLRTFIPGATWLRREALHLTVRFLGDRVPDSAVPRLAAVLTTLTQPPFWLTLSGVGRFPEDERKPPQVLWAGVEQTESLATLHFQLQSAIAPLGFPSEDRAFKPHLTLARLKLRQPQADVAQFLTRCADFRAEPFLVKSIILIQSTLTTDGALYHPLAVCPLSALT